MIQRSKLRWAGITASAVLLLVVAAILLLHSGPVRRYALDRAIEYLKTSQGIDFQAANVRYHLLRGTATLEGVVLRSSTAPDLPPLVRADRAHVKVGLLSLIRGFLHIEDAELEGASVQLVFEKNGRNNLPQVPERKIEEEAGTPQFLISRLRAPHVSFLYDDRARDILVRIPDSRLDVAGSMPGLDHKVTFATSRPVEARFGQRQASITGVSFEATLPGNLTGVALDRLQARLEKSAIQASGTLEDFTDPKLSFRVDVDADLQEISGIAGLEEPVAGRVVAHADITGPSTALRVEGQVKGNDVAVRQFRQLAGEAKLRWDGQSRRVEVPSLDLHSPLASATGQASIALDETSGTSTARLRLSGVDLQAVSRALKSEMAAASRASGNVEAEWRALDFTTVSGRANLRLDATRAHASHNVLPVSGQLSVESQNGRVRVSNSTVSIPGVAANLDVVLEGLDLSAETPNGRLAGQVRAEITDIGILAANLSAFSGEAPPQLELRGPAVLTSTLGGTLRKPSASVTVDSSSLQIGQLRDVAVRAAIEANTEQVRIKELAADWQNQGVTASGTVGLTGAPASPGGRRQAAAASPTLNLTAELRQTTIESLLAALEKKLPISGTANAQARIAGTIANPEADVDLRVTDLVAYSEPFGKLVARATLRNRVAEIPEARLEKPAVDGAGAGTLVASGSYNLDSQAYQLRVQSRGLEVAHLEVPSVGQVKGKLVVAGQGSGSVPDPALTLRVEAPELVVAAEGQKRGRDARGPSAEGWPAPGTPAPPGRAGVRAALGDVGPVVVAIELRNRVANVQFDATRFNLTAEGKVGIDAPYQTTFQARANGTDLSRLPVEVSGQPLVGNLTARISGEGPLERPESGRAGAEIEYLTMKISGQTIENQGPLRISYADSRLIAEPSTIVVGPSKLTIAGELPARGSGLEAGATGRITVDGNLDLAALAALLPPDSGVLAKGKGTIQGEIRGSLEKLAPNLRLTLADAWLAAPALKAPLEHLNLDATLADGHLALKTLQARLGTGSIDANGDIPLGTLPGELPFGLAQTEGPARLSATISTLALESFAGTPTDVTGTVSLRVDARASRAELASVSGAATFDQLHLRVSGIDLTQEGTSRLSVENGTARLDRFLLTGPETRIEARGSAGLKAPGTLDLRLDGQADAALLAYFAEDVRAAGDANFQLSLTGTRETPRVDGFFELAKSQIAMSEPAVQLTDFDLRLDLAGNRVSIGRLNGDLNGGTLTGSGQITYSPTALEDVSIDIAARNVFLEFPEGLRSASNADLQLRSRRDLLVLGGRIDILQGSYTEPVNLESELLGIVASQDELRLEGERSALLSRLRFNVAVASREPVVVDNNLAQLQMNMDTRLVGTFYAPALTGRIQLEEGGELYLRERTYYLDRGAITFNNESTIEPTLDITARTQARDAGENLDITLQLTGTPDDMTTSLTSDPPLPEPDLMSILVTGRHLEEARGQASAVVREQTLSLLAGGVAGKIGSELERATGLSHVRIEPNLISAESDPTARLTVGQDITRQLELIYSMNLADSSDQIYVGEYDLTRRFTTRLLYETNPKREEQEGALYRLEFRHDVRMGGGPNTGEMKSTRQRDRREVSAVNFSGRSPFPPQVLAERFDVDPGDDYNFFKIRRGMDRLDEFLQKQDYLESRVRLNRNEQASDQVQLNLQVTGGPKISFEFAGAPVSEDVRKQVREAWTKGVFDAQRAEDSIAAIRESLIDQGYLQARIDWEARSQSPEAKVVHFQVEPGPHFRDVQIEFPGASQLSEDQLRRKLEEAKLLEHVHTEPSRVADVLKDYYRQNGYLQGQIERPEYDLHPENGTGRLLIPVKEGPLSHLEAIRFEGSKLFTDEQLRAGLLLQMGEPYDPARRDQSIAHIREAYAKRGYNNAVIDYDASGALETGRMTITFRIEENQQEVVRKIRVTGNVKTDESFIRKNLEIKTGDLLDQDKVALSRRHLYDTGAYVLVDIQTEDIEADKAQKPNEKPVALTVNVREVRPYRLQYGGFYDNHRGPGLIADITNRNSIGNAAVLGFRTRYDDEFREGRFYYSQPRLGGLPVDTNAVAFMTREIRSAANFTVDRAGFSLQQQAKFRNQFVLSYGYRFERTHTSTVDPFLGDLDFYLNVAPFTSTLTRDLRDDILDATRGNFMSHSLEFAPQQLGSPATTLHFIRYFAQYFQYIPLSRPSEIAWSGGEAKPRLVYAGGARIGLSRGFGGQGLVPSERFFAGGGTTIRGFEQDTIGPLNEIGDPAGGQAVFILNNELRFPLISIFDGVGFVDVGNVYETVRDFNPFDVRSSAGLGLRVRTPYFLLRGDYGVKLDRKSGESAGELFFSIGQAF